MFGYVSKQQPWLTDVAGVVVFGEYDHLLDGFVRLPELVLLFKRCAAAVDAADPEQNDHLGQDVHGVCFLAFDQRFIFDSCLDRFCASRRQWARRCILYFSDLLEFFAGPLCDWDLDDLGDALYSFL